MNPTENPEMQEQVAGSSSSAKVRVMIADDPPIVRDGLKKLLSLEEDIEVVAVASDGREVLDQVEKHQPDIILLDLRMPNLDGISTLQTLQHRNCPAKVIILTASEDKNEFVQAMKLGARGIVLKQTASADCQEHPESPGGRDLAGFADHGGRHAPVRLALGGTRPGARRHPGAGAVPAQRARARNRGPGGPGLQEQRDGREDVH